MLVASEMIVYIPVSVLHSSLNDDTITILYRKVLGHGDIVQLCREIVSPWPLSIYLQKVYPPSADITSEQILLIRSVPVSY